MATVSPSFMFSYKETPIRQFRHTHGENNRTNHGQTMKKLHNNLVPLPVVKHIHITKCCFSFAVPVGGSPASFSEHSSQLQEEESPHSAACQTQGVPATEGETGGC